MNKLPALEDIRVFVTVARLMSFSQAAQQLLVSPAYISKRIKLLEENLGQILFFRTARSIKLTHEGQIILRSSEAMLAELEHMQEQLNACREEIRGSLRISCSTGFGSTYINPFILTLRESYPLLGIDLTLTDKSVDIINENIDVDIWKLEQQQESMTVTPNSKLTVNNGEVAKQWCLSGEGILLRSLWSVLPELQSGQLIRVLPQWHQTADVYAVYSRSIRTSANLRVFIENLEQFLTNNLHHERT